MGADSARAIRSRLTLTGALLCAPLCALAGRAGAQIVVTDMGGVAELKGLAARPEAAGRLVRLFTFDEQETNPGEVPESWYRELDTPQRPMPGFPSFNRARLVYASEGGTVFRGGGAVELPTAGGSTALVLGSGVLPVFGNADYLISAFVRTDGIEHARAGVLTELLDASGVVIAGTLSSSELVVTRGGWREVVAPVSVDLPNVAFVQVRLVLLQPEEIERQFPQPTRATSTFVVHPRDLSGRALFDDVSILQLPRVDVSASARGGVFVGSRPVATIRTTVRDLTGETLTLHADVLDAHGRVVQTRPPVTVSGQHNDEWTIDLPRAGWYRTRMRVVGTGERVVGGSVSDFLARYSPRVPTPTTRDAHRFGVDLADATDAQLPAIPATISALGLSSVALPAWTSDLTPDRIDQRRKTLAKVVGDLIMARIEPTLVLGPVPRALAWDARVEPRDAWGLLQFPPHVWKGYIEELVEPLGERVEHWQVGRVQDQDPFWRSRVREEVSATAGMLTRFAPGSILHLPTSIERAWETSGLATQDARVTLDAVVPATLTAQGIRAALPQLLARGEDVGLRLVLDGRTPQGQDGPTHQAALARQMVELWRLLPERGETDVSFMLSGGWRQPTSSGALAREKLHASPSLSAFSTLANLLADRRVVARLPVATVDQSGSGAHASDLVVAYVLAPLGAERRGEDGEAQFAGGRDGALVLWHEGQGQARAIIPAGLRALTRIDLDGNRSSITPSDGKGGDARSLELSVGESPIFIEGVDVEFLRFLAGVSVDPPSLDAALTTQDASILLSNPWPSSITGSVTVLEPGGMRNGVKDRSWRIAPRTTTFSILPGQRVSLPLTIGFSSNEEAGPKRFVLGIDLQAEEQYGLVQVERSVPLGLRDMSLDLSQVAASSGLIAVEAVVTNSSQRVLAVELTALAPGLPRSKATIVNLQPGKQASRRFSFDASKATSPEVLVSVVDKETDTRLNKSVRIEGLELAARARVMQTGAGEDRAAEPGE